LIAGDRPTGIEIESNHYQADSNRERAEDLCAKLGKYYDAGRSRSDERAFGMQPECRAEKATTPEKKNNRRLPTLPKDCAFVASDPVLSSLSSTENRADWEYAR
jgi:hypothetical protein